MVLLSEYDFILVCNYQVMFYCLTCKSVAKPLKLTILQVCNDCFCFTTDIKYRMTSLTKLVNVMNFFFTCKLFFFSPEKYVSIFTIISSKTKKLTGVDQFRFIVFVIKNVLVVQISNPTLNQLLLILCGERVSCINKTNVIRGRKTNTVNQ